MKHKLTDKELIELNNMGLTFLAGQVDLFRQREKNISARGELRNIGEVFEQNRFEEIAAETYWALKLKAVKDMMAFAGNVGFFEPKELDSRTKEIFNKLSDIRGK